MMKRIIRGVICWLALLPVATLAATALPPYVDTYQSQISVNRDAGLKVTETITVTTDGKTVRHGIYRDFPTRYSGYDGNTVRVAFKVLAAEMNGKPVSYHQSQRSNGVRIYLGSKATELPAGTYTFALTYSTTGQLGFFKNHDELYWNVTGNGWGFPIEQVKATVKLPVNVAADKLKVTAYTGSAGSKEQHYRSQVEAGSATFETTKPLAAHQGLTVVLGWPKGIVTQPSFVERNANDMWVYAILIAGIVIVLLYYWVVWSRHGKDPKFGAIMPEYYPPKGFTPAALRYISDMGFDNRVLTSAILNLAVKGALKIEQIKKKHYVLHMQTDFDGELSNAEAVLMKHLFLGGDAVDLKKTQGLDSVVEAYRKALKLEFESTYFETNDRYSLMGCVLSVIAVGAGILLNMKLMPVALFLVFFIFLSMGSKGRVRRSLGSRIKQGGVQSVVTIVILVFFFAIYAPEIRQLDIIYPWVYIVLLLFLMAINLLFVNLMKRPTINGAHLIKHVKGFKLFLAATERQQMNFRNPPEKTPKLFEKYLPYALALGVEQKWGEQFADVLANAQYQPQWYYGSNLMLFNAAMFSDTFTSNFNQAISSAATPPGSTSGFGGGGFSGGGGGGGGGGGW